MSEKFDTCRFRSPTKEKHGEKWCCGEDTKEMYYCYELGLRDLTPEHCKFCKHHQAKLEINKEE